MLIDHLAFVFPQYFPSYFRIIGRIAFPIFVFLIAQGCHHTSNMPKYLWRLFLFALIAEIPFDLARGDTVDFLSNTNIFYTLTLGVFAIYVYQWLTKHLGTKLGILPAIGILFAAVFAADMLSTDYGAWGVAFIFSMYIITNKPLKLTAMAFFCLRMHAPTLAILNHRLATLGDPTNLAWIIGYLTPVALVYFYNGKKGPNMRWAFYVFYPAHLLILALLSMMIA